MFCSPKKKINDKVLKKQQNSLFRKDKEYVNLFNNNVDFLDDEKKTTNKNNVCLKEKMRSDKTDQPCTVLTVHFSCCMLAQENQSF